MLPDEETEKQERRILSSSESQTLKQALAVADEVGWLNQNLWAGLVPFYGSSSITLGWIAGRVGRGVSRLQGNGDHAVHYLRMAEARGDDDLRPRSYAAGAEQQPQKGT